MGPRLVRSESSWVNFQPKRRKELMTARGRIGRSLCSPASAMSECRQIALFACLALLGASCCGCQHQKGQENLLLKQLANSDADQRWRAALSIRDSAPVASVFVQPLVKALDDQDARVRFAAAQAIGEAGPNAREHIPVLLKMANEHPDVQVRAALNEAVIKLNEAQ
jgi:hypothetical protein